MDSARLTAEVDRMATQTGIVGCALVDADTGLVWHAAGSMKQSDSVWEAAVDYWRLHDRQKLHFEKLGALRAAVMYHNGGVLAIFPCCEDPEVLLVAMGLHKSVDWHQWQQRVRELGDLVRGSAR
jgi:hypothetical protein